MLAAGDPARVQAWSGGTRPRMGWAPDFPWGAGPEDLTGALEDLKHWGTLEYGAAWADTFEQNGRYRPSEARSDGGPSSVGTRARPTLPRRLPASGGRPISAASFRPCKAPTLLMVSADEDEPIAVSEHVASLMPNARVETFPQQRWMASDGDIEAVNRPRLDAIARFIGLQPKPVVPDTIPFDHPVHRHRGLDRSPGAARRSRLETTHRKTQPPDPRSTLDLARIRERHAGDGFYATFDGPARAIHCAKEIHKRVRDLGLEVRAGVHTGECELVDGKCAGISVSTGARIAALAGPSQVLVSQTVKDLVAGSGFTFADVGEHELKGIPQPYRLTQSASGSGRPRIDRAPARLP